MSAVTCIYVSILEFPNEKLLDLSFGIFMVVLTSPKLATEISKSSFVFCVGPVEIYRTVGALLEHLKLGHCQKEPLFYNHR